MPYKLSSNKKAVLVLRNGKWIILKRHGTEKAAKKHLAALRINVGH